MLLLIFLKQEQEQLLPGSHASEGPTGSPHPSLPGKDPPFSAQMLWPLPWLAQAFPVHTHLAQLYVCSLGGQEAAVSKTVDTAWM